MLRSQGPPHLCASASTLRKQDIYLEGPGQLLAIERPQWARCSDTPLSTWPGSHSPSFHSTGVLGLCQEGTIPQGTWPDPEDSGAWARAWGARLGGHRDSGAQEGDLVPAKCTRKCWTVREQALCKGNWECVRRVIPHGGKCR